MIKIQSVVLICCLIIVGLLVTALSRDIAASPDIKQTKTETFKVGGLSFSLFRDPKGCLWIKSSHHFEHHPLCDNEKHR